MPSSQVGTALIAKLDQLFGDGDSLPASESWKSTFLSFPLPAAPYSPSDLAFAATNQTDMKAWLQSAASFARDVNRIPAVDDVWDDDGRLVWNVYGEALQQAIGGFRKRTEQEQQALDAARRVLRDESENETPAYRGYSERRQALVAKQQSLAAAKAAADMGDTAARAAFEAARPQLLHDVQMAQEALDSYEPREKVERALNTIRQLAGSGIVEIHNAAQQLELSSQMDANGLSFLLTVLDTPGFFEDHRAWARFVLDASEVDQLCQGAKPWMVKAAQRQGTVLGADSVNLEIQSISMETIKVRVVRPWFREELFRRRDWRLPEDIQPLSDGTPKGGGQLPAYVSAVVFVRNLDIQLKPNSAINDAVLQDLHSGKPRLLGPFMLDLPANEPPGKITRLQANVTLARQAPVPVVDRPVAGLGLHPAAAVLAKGGTKEGLTLIPDRPPWSPQDPAGPLNQPPRIKVRPEWFPHPPPTPSPPVPKPEPKDPGMQLVAYVCSRVPKCPDPDEQLEWW